MDKIKAFIVTITTKLSQKKGLIDAIFFQYQNLMATDISQIQITNINESVLANDPVYNNPLASEQIKQAIANRNLLGMSPEDFEDAYKSILYGMSPKDTDKKKTIKPTKPEKSSADTTLSAIDKQVSLDQVPTHISRETAILAGHTEKYLLRICRENNLTLRQLQTLLELKNEYSTKMPTLLSLLEQNLSIAEVQIFLETREILTQADNQFSLINIIIFQDNFFDVALDAEFLAEKINEACNLLVKANPHYDKLYPDIKLKTILQIAYKMKTACLEVVLDWLETCSQIPMEKGRHEYPEHRHFSAKSQFSTKPSGEKNQEEPSDNDSENEESEIIDSCLDDDLVDEEDDFDNDAITEEERDG